MMNTAKDWVDRLLTDDLGDRLYALAGELYPILRSITGPGVRETLGILGRHASMKVHEVPTGTPLLDWTAPNEWAVREAYIADASGRRVVDIRNHALHIVHYSEPVRTRLPLSELRKHIFTLPGQPDLIPYRTGYYNPGWGFCMAHRELEALADGEYEVVIDATLGPGSVTYGEAVLPGRSQDEIHLGAHVCHPALANDNCSGMAVLALLGEALAQAPRKHTIRCLFAPGTIGAIAWLARNETRVDRIKSGFMISCVGDAGGPMYKRSRRGDALVDRAMAHVLRQASPQSRILDFEPYGYDERQYCSPGFDLPIGLFSRSQFGTFPEYHTSADSMEFIAPEHLALSYRLIAKGLAVLEFDRVVTNLHPKGEPQLGRRGLYGGIGGDKDVAARNMAMLWVLNLGDGRHTLLDIAERSGIDFFVLEAAACALEAAEVIQTGPEKLLQRGVERT